MTPSMLFASTKQLSRQSFATLEELMSFQVYVGFRFLQTQGNSIMTAATHPLARHGLPSFIGGADGRERLPGITQLKVIGLV